MRLMGITIWLLVIPIIGWCQLEPSNPVIKIDCPPLPDLKLIDSTIIRNDVASGYVQLSGHWQWVELRGGWGHITKITRPIYMVINQQGQGRVYENDRYISTYQVQLQRSFNHFYFKLVEPIVTQREKPFFQFNQMSNSRGYLRICEEVLVMGEAMGDGREWAFKRVTRNTP
jgi:hypothetical protein